MPFPRVSRKDSTEERHTEWLGTKVWQCAGAYLCSAAQELMPINLYFRCPNV
jgi:hypothetical protein